VHELEPVLKLLAELDPLGVYLFGSAAEGGLQPRSDLDVLAVLKRRTTDAEKQRLLEALRALPGRPVEVTLVAHHEAPAYKDFQWGAWLPDTWESGEDPDLAILIHKVLLADHALAGPPPGTLLAAIPPERLRASMLASVDPILEGLHEDTTNALLALCRIYYSLVTGAIASKGDAAAWAHARFPHVAINRARAIYLGGLPDDYTGIDVDYAAANLRALIAQQDRT
jgi:streptomycin 3"-adenylyltransferase